MSRLFYYKETQVIYFSVMGVFFSALVGLMVLFILNLPTIAYFIYALLVDLAMYILKIIFFHIDYRRFTRNIEKMDEECRYVDLQDYILKIDSYFQPKLFKGVYRDKKLRLKTFLILAYLKTEDVDEANRIHTETVPYVNRDRKYLHDEISFRFLFLAIQIRKQDIGLIEEELAVIKERMLHFKSKKVENLFASRVKYYEVRYNYLKEEYEDLDIVLLELIEKQEKIQDILIMKYVLGEIYIKQGKNEDARQQFKFILAHNENYFKYQEAKNYYEIL